MKKGTFITIEGVDGGGKTTQIELLKEWCDKRGLPVLFSQEPGGTPVGDAVRAVLLDKAHSGMCPETELFLFAAQRAQHTREVIMPALNKGIHVVSSRYADATTVYQGFVRGLDLAFVAEVNRRATGGLEPDVAIVIDIDETESLRRLKGAGALDRMESEGISFLEKVREGYLRLAAMFPERVVVVDGTASPALLHEKIAEIITCRIELS